VTNLITACPACGHHTSAAVAGRCSTFVPGPADGPLAVYCGCNCYQALTGRDLHDDLAAVLHGPTPRQGES
jgi:hypothetical protein